MNMENKEPKTTITIDIIYDVSNWRKNKLMEKA